MADLQLPPPTDVDNTLDAITQRAHVHLTRAATISDATTPPTQSASGPTSTSFAAGERYELRTEIGSGGMGSVMLAQDKALSRTVAVKVLHAGDDDLKRAFAREAAIAARLDHPNIVPLYDAGVDAKGKPYLAMRYVEGDNLRAVIRKLKANDVDAKKHWSIEARCRLVLQLLSALSLAHARGILHRDIKPENVMIGPFGEVLLVDWGIACTPSETGSDEGIIGTPRYLSPEQADGEPLDARSDLYSLSVLFYELLTLKHPQDPLPQDGAAIVAAVLSRDCLAAEHVHERGQQVVPRALSLVVMKGLETDPDQRYPSADAYVRAIEQYLAGDAPVVCPHTAYAYGLGRIGRLLDAFPRLTIGATFAIGAFALFGAVELVIEALRAFR